MVDPSTCPKSTPEFSISSGAYPCSYFGRIRLIESATLSFPIQHRIKSWSSVSEKMERIGLQVTELKDMQDLIGFRLVLQFRRDLEHICETIHMNFDVIDMYDTIDRLREDQFGYSSIHFIVKLPDQWLLPLTMADLGDLRAEIQVRTTAQHIWAAASHALQYKHETSVPAAVRRSLSRVSALLETVDLELERVLRVLVERERYKIASAESRNPQDVLNVDLIEHILDETSPIKNKAAGREDYARLLEDLKHLGLTTRDHLLAVLLKHREQVLKEDGERAARLKQELANPKLAGAYDPERIAQGIFFIHVGLTRRALVHEFGSEWKKYFLPKET